MKNYIISILLAFSFALSAGVPAKPKQERLVNDFANILNDNQERALEQKLVKYDSQTSTQIAVITLSDLEGLSSIEMATRIMKQWGVGGSKDNGIVIVFKPKTNASKGQIAITTGHGVEHLVTDALAKEVVEFDLIPFFKKGDIYGGFDNGTNVLMSLTSGEFTGEDYLADRKSGSRPNFIFIIFIIIAVISRVGRARRFGHMSSGGSSLPFWMLMGMSGGSSSHSGSFSDFSSGGGSFGGFGGGFGGGGGASGSW